MSNIRKVMDQVLAGEIDWSLRSRERALMDASRHTLLVNLPGRRPPQKNFFMPSRLITNASPTGSSNPRAALGFYTGATKAM